MSVLKKLNYKGQATPVVLHAPDACAALLAEFGETPVVTDLAAVSSYTFALVFATQQSEVNALAAALCPKAEGDAILWFAYPKGTSKKYRCDFNRDIGWDAVRAAGFDTVRQVAIDEDWSALRFRKVDYIGR
ncbi:hypothetical protein KSF73_06350 [Burkholderiaceae bacterium DAT-1]|nr:hypothetical protein [Burkholderiaceae bacterium DAT-1]